MSPTTEEKFPMEFHDLVPDGDLDDEIPENELEAEPNHEEFRGAAE